MSLPYQRIWVTGHRGMVGSALCRSLAVRFPTIEILTQERSQLDLTDERAVSDFVQESKPDCILFAASKVGGILANANFPVEFLADNVKMAVSTIQAAYQAGVQRFLYLGSTCIYPRLAPQPIREDSLLTSALETTNEAYALAKIVGLKLCQYYRRQYGVLYHSAMPTNLYGPGDNYHPEHSHVIPAMIRRFHEAKLSGADSVAIWGTGTPRREFLYVEDLADALLHLIALADPPDWVNVGVGSDLSILELAHEVAKAVGFDGRIVTDPSKPDGTPRKLTDTTLLQSTGWRPTVPLQEGLRRAYADFLVRTANGTLRSQ